MIQSINIIGVNYEVNELTRKYVAKKLGRLDRYLARAGRDGIGLDVTLARVDRPHGNKHEVSVKLRLPDAVIEEADSTTNILAAVDIVEVKLTNALRERKSGDSHKSESRGGIRRFGRSKPKES